MADETKKYLIDIQSNLPKYIQDAANAKKTQDELKASLDELKKSETATNEQIEAAGAALRSAQKDYKNAKTAVDLVTQSNKYAEGSYEKLYVQWVLAQKELKASGDAMIKNADGTYSLSQKHLDASKKVDNLKKALDSFGKSIHNNTLNVGNYSEAIDGLKGTLSAIPGPLGSVVSKAESAVTTIAKIGPYGAVAAAAIMSISLPLTAFFTKSEKGMDMLEQKTAGLKAAFRVLVGELVESGDKMANAFDKPEKKASSFWTKVLSIFGPAWTTTGILMDQASDAAEKYTKKIQEMEDAEIAIIPQRAQANLQIKEARLLYADTTKSYQVRLDALQRAIDLENEVNDIEVEHAIKQRDNLKVINDEKLKAGQLLREDQRKLAEAEAHIIDLQSESAGRQVRAAKAISNAKKEILAEQYKLIASEEKYRELAIKMDVDALKAQRIQLKSEYDKQNDTVGKSFEEREKIRKEYQSKDAEIDRQMIEEQKRILSEQMQIQLKEVDTIIQPASLANMQKLVIQRTYYEALAALDIQAKQQQADRDEKERERKKKQTEDDITAGFEAQRLKVENNAVGDFQDTGVLNTLLDAEYANMLKSVEYEKMTSNQKLKIEAQYNAAKKQLSEQRKKQLNEEKQVVANAFGAMSDILGENTIVGKMMGIAQATINTWVAASEALATYPPPYSYIAMAASIASGLATVKNILKVKVPGKSSTSSVETDTSVPHATGTQSPNIFQSQLTQAQLNALPTTGSLNSGDLAKAIGQEISKMPAPKVSVEDINAKIKNTAKVEVKSNI